MTQVRINMNANPNAQTPSASQRLERNACAAIALGEPFQITCDPVDLDYRDNETVWIWIADNLCIEMSREEVEAIAQGFDEQEEIGELEDEGDDHGHGNNESF